jgi:hypothetical protein
MRASGGTCATPEVSPLACGGVDDDVPVHVQGHRGLGVAGPSLDRLRVETLGKPQRDPAVSEVVRGVGGALGVSTAPVDEVSNLAVGQAREDEAVAMPVLECL